MQHQLGKRAEALNEPSSPVTSMGESKSVQTRSVRVTAEYCICNVRCVRRRNARRARGGFNCVMMRFSVAVHAGEHVGCDLLGSAGHSMKKTGCPLYVVWQQV